MLQSLIFYDPIINCPPQVRKQSCDVISLAFELIVSGIASWEVSDISGGQVVAMIVAQSKKSYQVPEPNVSHPL